MSCQQFFFFCSLLINRKYFVFHRLISLQSLSDTFKENTLFGKKKMSYHQGHERFHTSIIDMAKINFYSKQRIEATENRWNWDNFSLLNWITFSPWVRFEGTYFDVSLYFLIRLMLSRKTSINEIPTVLIYIQNLEITHRS